MAEIPKTVLTHGGVRERMHAARTAARGESWGKAVYSRLDGAAAADELATRLYLSSKADKRYVLRLCRLCLFRHLSRFANGRQTNVCMDAAADTPGLEIVFG